MKVLKSKGNFRDVKSSFGNWECFSSLDVGEELTTRCVLEDQVEFGLGLECTNEFDDEGMFDTHENVSLSEDGVNFVGWDE